MATKATKRTTRRARKQPSGGRTPRILAVDIGGTSVKLLASGETKPRKFASGKAMTPEVLVKGVAKNARDWKYDVVTLGYPGLVSASGPVTEPANLGPGWVGFDFASAFGCPVRVVNDATMQAIGSYDGGRMLFLGFGTGVGSVLIVDQAVVRLELGELKWKGKLFYEHFGKPALKQLGGKRWRTRVLETIPSLQRAFLTDYIVIGGGNAKYVLEPLPPNVRIGHNLTAFRGGYRVWGVDLNEAPQGAESSQARSPLTREWRLL